MQIVKVTPCPGCQYSIRVSVKRLPKGLYTVAFFDGHDKNARSKTTQCPRCKIDLFQSGILKALTGLETAQISS